MVLARQRQDGVRLSTTVGFLLAAPVLDPLLFAAFAVLFSAAMAISYSLITFAGVLAVAVLAGAARTNVFRSLGKLSEDVAEASCSTALEVPSEQGPEEPVSAGAESISSEPTSSTRASSTGPDCEPAGSGASEATCRPALLADDPVDSSGGEAGWRGWRSEAQRAWQEAVDLTRGMAWHIVGAVAIAALVMGYLPEDLLLSVADPERWYAIPAAAMVGMPFYVSVEALAPVGAALASKGMSVGAVFALTIAGAGVNVPEFALLSKLLTRRGLLALVSAVFAVAVAGSFAMQAL